MIEKEFEVMNRECRHTALLERWRSDLDRGDMPSLSGREQRIAVSVMLANVDKDRRYIMEAIDEGGGTYPPSSENPVPLARRVASKLLWGVCGVQPVEGPTAIIFLLRPRRISDATDSENHMAMAIDKHAVAMESVGLHVPPATDQEEIAKHIADGINRDILDHVARASRNKGVHVLDDDESWEEMRSAMDKEADAIEKETLRGKGNFVVVSRRIGEGLEERGFLDGDSEVPRLRDGKMVHVDPFSDVDYFTVGYKGEIPYDAGLIYCPYVLLLEKIDDEGNHVFSTRRVFVENLPFRYEGRTANEYYRRVEVKFS